MQPQYPRTISLSFPLCLYQQVRQFIYLRDERQALVLLYGFHLLLQLNGLSFLSLQEIALYHGGIGEIAHQWLEGAILGYLPLFLLSHFLQLIVFILHVIEQPLEHVFLEVVLLFHYFLRLLTHLRSVLQFNLLLLLSQDTYGLSLLCQYLIESLVYGGQIGPIGLLLADVGMESAVLLLQVIGGTGPFMQTFHPRQTTLIQPLKRLFILPPLTLGQSFGLGIDDWFEGTSLGLRLFLFDLLCPQGLCPLLAILHQAFDELVLGYFSLGPFGVEFEGESVDLRSVGGMVCLHLTQGVHLLHGSLLGGKGQVPVVVHKELVLTIRGDFRVFGHHRQFELQSSNQLQTILRALSRGFPQNIPFRMAYQQKER